MTKEAILKKAIEKAEKNGWDSSNINIGDKDDFIFAWDYTEEEILFDHDFAKAFWGEERIKVFEGEIREDYGDYFPEAWQYHLQQLALSEDRLEYLRPFVEEDGKSMCPLCGERTPDILLKCQGCGEYINEYNQGVEEEE